MAKNKVFKKITALAMAIALVVCFAVSASAEVNVSTTTKYVGDDIEVNVTVTATEGEIAEGTNVTYYATNGDGNVHIDQVKATGSSATFNFNVDGVAQLNSDVKIGYTGASAAKDEKITGYTVTYPDGSSEVLPTEDATSVQFAYTPSAQGKAFDTVTLTGDATLGTAEESYGTVTVTFASITGDVTIAVVEKTSVVETAAVPEVLAVGAVYVKENKNYEAGIKIDGYYDDNGNKVVDSAYNADAVGNRKVTVIGKATDAEEFGVIISETAIEAKQYTADEFKAAFVDTNKSFSAITKNDKGKFAVQIIDTNNEAGADLIKADTNYYTAVYVKDEATGVYEVAIGSTVRASSAVTE